MWLLTRVGWWLRLFEYRKNDLHFFFSHPLYPVNVLHPRSPPTFWGTKQREKGLLVTAQKHEVLALNCTVAQRLMHLKVQSLFAKFCRFVC